MGLTMNPQHHLNLLKPEIEETNKKIWNGGCREGLDKVQYLDWELDRDPHFPPLFIPPLHVVPAYFPGPVPQAKAPNGTEVPNHLCAHHASTQTAINTGRGRAAHQEAVISLHKATSKYSLSSIFQEDN